MKREWFIANKLNADSFGALPLLESEYPKSNLVICTKPAKVQYCTAQFNENVQIHKLKILRREWFLALIW